jgi:hypothetical protein
VHQHQKKQEKYYTDNGYCTNEGEIKMWDRFVDFLFEKRFTTKQFILLQCIVISFGLFVGWLIGRFIIFK